jgi:imidazolonepropionase-like amidohydrolase
MAMKASFGLTRRLCTRLPWILYLSAMRTVRTAFRDTAAVFWLPPEAPRTQRRRALGTWCGAALLIAVACGGQNAAPAPDQGVDGTLFTGARLLIGDGAAIEDGAFLVRDRRFMEVGRTGSVQAPEGVATVSLSGRTVMPALVNAHSHLGWEKYTSWGSQNFTRENLIDHLFRHAYYGVGTVISTGSDKEEIALEVQRDQRLGKVGGAHYIVQPGIGTPGGGPNPNFTADPGFWGQHGVSSPEEARRAVRAEAAKGVRVIKIWVDRRDEQRGAKVKLSPEIYRAIVDEAIVHDIRVLAHAPLLDDHKQLLRAGVRRIIHGPSEVDDEWIALMKERNAYLIPTVGVFYRNPKYYEDPFFREHVSAAVLARLSDPANLGPVGRGASAVPPAAPPPVSRLDPAAIEESRRKRFMRMNDAGIQIILGADVGWGPTATLVGTFFGYAEHEELAAFVRLGMTPSQAVVAATKRPAEAFGLDTVGTIEPGKSADFIVLEANPVDDIANTRRIADVYLRGERIDRAALRARWRQ